MFDITLELDKLNRENLEKFRDFLETFSPVCPKDSANMPLFAPVVQAKGLKTS